MQNNQCKMKNAKGMMQAEGSRKFSFCVLNFESCNSRRAGFTLLEIMIAVAIVGGLLVTLIYTLNHHLGIAGRHEFLTVASLLAKEKIYEMEKKPVRGNGDFPEPFSKYRYVTDIKESIYPGLSEISVVVSSGGSESVQFTELIQSAK